MNAPKVARRNRLRLGIVGGGPNATYAVERLAAYAVASPGTLNLELHVFDQHGAFGDGAVHDADQPGTSLLLRVVGEVSMAMDEAVLGKSDPILDRSYRPTLHEFARRKLAETGDPDFDLEAHEHPTRRLHGLALRESFREFLALVRRHAACEVHLHHDEVVDITDGTNGALLIHCAGPGSSPTTLDRVLLATGAGIVDPESSRAGRALVEFARRTGSAYVPAAYPLQMMLPESVAGPNDVVGCRGMGVTAADIILYLTEGRGGAFEEREDGRLTYRPSGREPKAIVPFGRSGIFNYAKPVKTGIAGEKIKPVFWTIDTVDRVRAASGQAVVLDNGATRWQLDFDAHLMPVVVLEMTLIYYRTLLGPDFADWLARLAKPAFDDFIRPRIAEPVDPNALLHAVGPDLLAAITLLDQAFDGAPLADAARAAEAQGWHLLPSLERYLDVVFGTKTGPAGPSGEKSLGSIRESLAPRWRMQRRPIDNMFDWLALSQPLASAGLLGPDGFARAALDVMDRDNHWSAQGNQDNPAKAAMDSVWRGTRGVFTHAVIDGGLTADSHRRFLRHHKSHRARLAIGAPPSSMRKIQALAESGLVDLSIGPGGSVETGAGDGRFHVQGRTTGADVRVDVVVEALVPNFDAERMSGPLFGNLLRRGMVRRWRNPSVGGEDFVPGGVEFNESFQPYRRDGSVERRLGILGAPTEGQRFQQTGLARPGVNHHNLRDVKAWMDAVLRDYEDGQFGPSASLRPVGKQRVAAAR